MLNFKTANLLFIPAIILCIFFNCYSGLSLWWTLIPILVYKAIVIYGCANIRSNFFTQVYCSGNTTEKKIAITFDDGPNPHYTAEVIKILAEYNAPATFFVIGKNIKENEELLKQMDAAGHIIGNHTFSHSFFIDFKSKLGFIFELDQTSDLVFNTIGKRMKFFRPPYGVTTPNLARASRALNYSIVGWNIRSLDTKNEKDEIVFNRVKEQLKPGAVILFHDTSAKSVNVLKQTLNFAKENGFIVVSAEELLKLKAYH